MKNISVEGASLNNHFIECENIIENLPRLRYTIIA
jgi:hypothetical protein